MTNTDPQPKPRRKPQAKRRGNIVGLVVVVVIAAGLFWLITAIVQHNAVQNCIDSGRRDCVPLPGSG